MPCFEGILPDPFNSIILDLLFVLAMWHGLAKLRLHTEYTLDVLDYLTTTMGQLLRKFKSDVCPSFPTKPLNREEEATKRRKTKKSSASTQGKQKGKGRAKATDGGEENFKKVFKLDTPKLHALGDYVATICRFGTTDIFSTQRVSPLSSYPLCI